MTPNFLHMLHTKMLLTGGFLAGLGFCGDTLRSPRKSGRAETYRSRKTIAVIALDTVMNVRQVETTYISRMGQHLEMNLADPELKAWLNTMTVCMRWYPQLEDKIHSGARIITSLDYDKIKQATEYKPKHVTAASYSGSAGILFHSTQEVEPYDSAGLGHLVFKNAMVCREKAMLTHLFLAELGIPTQYVSGSVSTGGEAVDGHAWVEWHQSASSRGGTAQAVIDGTWGKIYTDFSYDEFVVNKKDPETYFEPIQEFDATIVEDAFGILGKRQ